MLLSYETLALDSHGIGAVRFGTGVRIRSLRVFPTGSRPFIHADVVARTEPNAFYFDLYLNAQANATVPKDKQKAPNALAHTRIAYAGEQSEFPVDMGPEYTTRVLIIRGEFKHMSLAVYGMIHSEIATPTAYTPANLHVLDATPLHAALDVASMEDPTALARTLLSLISSSLSMSTIPAEALCRLDNHQNSFHPDVDMTLETLDLHELFNQTRHSWMSHLEPFVQLFDEALNREGTGQLSLVSGIIRNVARWQPQAMLALLEVLNSHGFDFARTTITYDTLARLTEAASNQHVAAFLNSEAAHRNLGTVLNDLALDPDHAALVKSLKARLQGWDILSDALHNTRGGFSTALAFIDDLVEDQSSLGVWMHYLAEDPEFLSRLSENPSISGPPPPSIEEACTSHDTFVSYLRALIGVGLTTCVLLYTDGRRHPEVGEKILDIIQLWRLCPGYREITTRFILLPAVQASLRTILAEERPSKRGLRAEEILSDLATDPRAHLHDEFVDNLEVLPTLVNLDPDHEMVVRGYAETCGQTSIAVLEQLGANVALSGNLETLQLLLAMVNHELQGNTDGHHSTGGTPTSAILRIVSDALSIAAAWIGRYFHFEVSLARIHDVTSAFVAAHEALRLLLLLIPVCSVADRSTIALVSNTIAMFVSTWYADTLFSAKIGTCAAVQSTRHLCVDVLRALSTQSGDGASATVVLRSLFTGALQFTGDPSIHLAQVFYLVSQVIPTESNLTAATQQIWSVNVIPNVLPELSSFVNALDPENKAHLGRMLADIDNGTVGFIEWFLHEELRRLHSATQAISASGHDDQLQSILECDAYYRIHTLKELLSSGPSWESWTTSLMTNTFLRILLTESLEALVPQKLVSQGVFDIAQIVLQECFARSSIPHECFFLAMIYCAQSPEIDRQESMRMLGDIALVLQDSINRETTTLLGRELRLLVLQYVDTVDVDEGITPELANSMHAIVSWMDDDDADYLALNPKFREFCDRLSEVLSPNAAQQLRIRVQSLPGQKAEQEDIAMVIPRLLNSRPAASLDDLKRLLSPPQVPRTPVTSNIELVPDLLAVVTVSPSALLHSPATSTTGLTKTYANNAFRDQTQRTPSNTSRMPSMHVDDFELESPIVPTTTLFAPGPIYPSE